MTAAACAAHIPLTKVPAHVRVIRNGHPRSGASFLRVGDEIRVRRPGHLVLSYAGNRFWIWHGQVRLRCRDLLLAPHARHGRRMHVLAVWIRSGRVKVLSGVNARRAVVVSREMLAYPTSRRTSFVVRRQPRAHSTQAWTRNRPIVAARTSDQDLRLDARVTYTASSGRRGLRLDIWPFSISRRQRATTGRDDLVPFWADGRSCSVGCTAPGAIAGWPVKPFHRQHAIRAGINELRPANFHVAVDIQAHNFQPVYAIQSGYASVRYRGTGDVNVDVGNFYYWHVNPSVSDGQYVSAYHTVIGHVLYGFTHVALSEGSTSDYLNPLRPGGSLHPYTDTERPVIGVPRIFSDGRVIVGAFDPQSFVARGFQYETPVLAPAALAWRLYDAHGHALTGLEWALRGSQNYPPNLKPVVFAPGASAPGFECFATRHRCIPNWVYWLAGGLTQRLPLNSLRRGRYRLAVYAWDWTGKTSALDYWFRAPLAHGASSAGEFGPLSPPFDYDETGNSGPPPRAP
ncbi:MAG: hypothetical protein ACJ764_03050 [Solirubrobacteraceae bacterium]